MVTNNDIKIAHHWFHSFVRQHYSPDSFIQQNIRLKEDHTLRVCSNIKTIATNLHVSESDKALAELMALFHDLGRFEQFTKYKTFSDLRSINHAELSVLLLKKHKILAFLPKQEQELIYEVITYHNLHHLPEIHDETVLFFSQLLRDADKLDVFHVLLHHYQQTSEEKNPALDLHYPNSPGYSSVIIQQLQQGQSTTWAMVQNLNDMKLLQLSWIYDINFQPTLEEIKKRGYIDAFFSLLPDDDIMNKIHQQITQVLTR